MKTIEVKVYKYSELSEAAKGNARAWYCEGALDYDWWQSIYDDAERLGLKLTGFDLDRNHHATGEFTMPAAHVIEAILKEHGEACETYKTAKQFEAEFKKLSDNHPEDEEEWNTLQDEQDEEFLKSILEDYSILLQKESEYLTSDEAVEETILANEYTFTESGKRFG